MRSILDLFMFFFPGVISNEFCSWLLVTVGPCNKEELMKMSFGIFMLNIRALPFSLAAWLGYTKHLKNGSLSQEASLRGRRQRQAWFTSLANPVPPGILDFCKPLHRSRSWAWVLALSAADSTWLRLLRQHSVRDLSCTMFGNFLRD